MWWRKIGCVIGFVGNYKTEVGASDCCPVDMYITTLMTMVRGWPSKPEFAWLRFKSFVQSAVSSACDLRPATTGIDQLGISTRTTTSDQPTDRRMGFIRCLSTVRRRRQMLLRFLEVKSAGRTSSRARCRSPWSLPPPCCLAAGRSPGRYNERGKVSTPFFNSHRQDDWEVQFTFVCCALLRPRRSAQPSPARPPTWSRKHAIVVRQSVRRPVCVAAGKNDRALSELQNSNLRVLP